MRMSGFCWKALLAVVAHSEWHTPDEFVVHGGTGDELLKRNVELRSGVQLRGSFDSGTANRGDCANNDTLEKLTESERRRIA
jgi:hypothetical protein